MFIFISSEINAFRKKADNQERFSEPKNYTFYYEIDGMKYIIMCIIRLEIKF